MSEEQKSEIKVGKPVPALCGQAVVGQKIVQLSYEAGELTVDGQKSTGHYLVLFFYPLDFTFVCPTEIVAFHKKVSEFEKVGARVIGVSVDSPYTHLAWKNTPRNNGGLGEIDFPLFADLDKKVSRNYEVLLEEGIAARGVFIIDPDGVLQSFSVNNLGVGRNIDEIIRLIEAFKFVGEHGEVCPANWNLGDSTMKPDTAGSKEYFAEVQ
ncbi:MAG: redoxin domain-containing protein [Planctomycetota bacterium]|jgi:peroxiredoxin (alkyl hydroperoxide reductase subunit C)